MQLEITKLPHTDYLPTKIPHTHTLLKYKGNENLLHPSSDATFLSPPHWDFLSNNKHSHNNNSNHPDRNGKTTRSICSLTTRLGRRTSTTNRPRCRTSRRTRLFRSGSCPRFSSPYKQVNLRTWGVEGGCLPVAAVPVVLAPTTVVEVPETTLTTADSSGPPGMMVKSPDWARIPSVETLPSLLNWT